MEIGSIWNGWEVVSLLGEGSFGKVYKIEKKELGYVYDSALKVIRIPQSDSEVASIKSQGMDDESVTMYFKSMVEELVSEFALMSKFKGTSNIVSYEDHAIKENEDSIGWTIYIRMELLTPMYEYLRDNELSVRNVIKLGIDMCQALELCQKYNIIHRDIKPENIFVSKFGDFKLGDFGIARQLEKTSSGMSKKGTYTYMAPEVYKGMQYNSTVDIYSLGIVLYSFLNNNRTPFLPPYPQTIKYSDKEKANVLRMSGREIPNPDKARGRLAEIILKACAYNPNDRYESAVELRRALESVLFEESEAQDIYPDGNDILNKSTAKVPKEEDKKCSNPPKAQVTTDNEPTMYLFKEQEEKARKEAEERAKREAEEKARKEAEDRAKREAEEKARKEAEERAKREAEEKARKEAEERAKREAEEKARKEAEERAKREAEEKARKEAEERAKREAEEKARKEAEERAKREAEEKARIKAQERAKREAEKKAKKDAEKQAKIQKKVEKEPQKSKTKRLIIIGSIALAVVVVVIVAVISCSGSKFLTVPNVVGMTEKSATLSLKDAKLSYKVEYENFDDVKEGCVAFQSKKEGSTVDPDTKITIVVSVGKAIYVPDLIGLTTDKAEKLLDGQNLLLEVESEKYSNTVSAGCIIEQSVGAETQLEKGDTVKVVVSKGEEKFTVPNVKGMTESAAKSKLEQSSLKAKVKSEYSGSVAKGKVISQSISSGKKVSKGTVVTITVSKGKKPVSNTSSTASHNSDNYNAPDYDTPSYNPPSNNSSSYTPPNNNAGDSPADDSDDDIIGMIIE